TSAPRKGAAMLTAASVSKNTNPRNLDSRLGRSGSEGSFILSGFCGETLHKPTTHERERNLVAMAARPPQSLMKFSARRLCFLLFSFGVQALDQEFESSLGLFRFLQETIVADGAPEQIFGVRKFLVGVEQSASETGQNAGDAGGIVQRFESRQRCSPRGD